MTRAGDGHAHRLRRDGVGFHTSSRRKKGNNTTAKE
uniref:Uncharacterized protein n=1 Tax=Siphoviridae sp. ctfdk3 TaxID=2826416 RepID=A0A8S5NJV9_9CAUD|nr:MAG TPA: hypothetical protein [Siphoviridae sp. ctfdk3]